MGFLPQISYYEFLRTFNHLISLNSLRESTYHELFEIGFPPSMMVQNHELLATSYLHRSTASIIAINRAPDTLQATCYDESEEQ